jgi:hypothetical protein
MKDVGQQSATTGAGAHRPLVSALETMAPMGEQEDEG